MSDSQIFCSVVRGLLKTHHDHSRVDRGEASARMISRLFAASYDQQSALFRITPEKSLALTNPASNQLRARLSRREFGARASSRSNRAQRDITAGRHAHASTPMPNR